MHGSAPAASMPGSGRNGSDRTVDSQIKTLRRLADLMPDEELIRSVYGVGYR